MKNMNVKQIVFLILIFVIVWWLTYMFGADYSQGQDRKKFIFKPIEYYQEMWFWLGLIVSGGLVGALIYKLNKDN